MICLLKLCSKSDAESFFFLLAEKDKSEIRLVNARLKQIWIIHVIQDDMPICCFCFHYLHNCFENERKYFCHIQHSWLCSSYWHFHTHDSFGAWGILFLLLSRLLFLETCFLITKKMGNLLDVLINDVSVITHRKKWAVITLKMKRNVAMKRWTDAEHLSGIVLTLLNNRRN